MNKKERKKLRKKLMKQYKPMFATMSLLLPIMSMMMVAKVHIRRLEEIQKKLEATDETLA